VRCYGQPELAPNLPKTRRGYNVTFAMATRPYRGTKRAEQSAQTREQCLAAARELMIGSGFHRLTLDEVAKAAGVTRVTIYNQFGSKLGLLDAMLDAFGRRGSAGRMTAAGGTADPWQGLVATITETVRFWNTDRPFLRRLLGLAAVDPDTGAAIERREDMRRHGWALVAEAFAGTGELPPGATKADAITVFQALSSFAMFDALQPEGVTATDDTIATLTAFAKGWLTSTRAVPTPPAASRSGSPPRSRRRR
jgi:AcrR family transcriptional regulator